MLHQFLIHIHVARGTWHLSEGRLVTLNLCVNLSICREKRVINTRTDEMLILRFRLAEK